MVATGLAFALLFALFVFAFSGRRIAIAANALVAENETAKTPYSSTRDYNPYASSANPQLSAAAQAPARPAPVVPVVGRGADGGDDFDSDMAKMETAFHNSYGSEPSRARAKGQDRVMH